MLTPAEEKVRSRGEVGLAARTCQECCGFGGRGEYERHRVGDPNAWWHRCITCGGTGQKSEVEP